ncbi:FhuF-like iron-sulfur protein [Blastococcus colisei]|uniref:FhuF-like iron-sulfur protein n=1 Tax=Blastococcus colisei TaxID=1564162 RepID=A0A543P139_9ACTN|nr:(2Fe-2S)-binding protein [Blastococcus colisei]TQN37789.1 FhuF-like iron-sulfur protein [Blastococcus colisei]
MSETGQVATGNSDAVVARLLGADALGLVLPPSGDVVPAVSFADLEWTAGVLERRARRFGSADRRVLATVWWYSASSVLLTPPLAGLVTGIPLSARLADLSVAMLPGPLPAAAEAGAAGSGDLAADLRDSLGAVIAAVAEAGRMRERPLWAIATDSLANRLLALGQATGKTDRATGLAVPLAASVGPPLPSPRYEDVAGRRFVRRASCCLLDRTPGGPTCTSCPRRPPAERRRLLERLTGGVRGAGSRE